MMKFVNILLFLVCLKYANSDGARLWQKISATDHKFTKYCDFSLWGEMGYEPEYSDTCTNKYYTWVWENNKSVRKEHMSDSSWCPVKAGNGANDWTRCTYYRWNYEVNHNFLGYNTKEYEYGFLRWDRNNYRNARRSCLEKGVGWDLASFQTMFNTSMGEIYQDDNYYQSMENLRSILHTLKGDKYDTYHRVWVRNDQSFASMGKYEKAKNLQHAARNCLVYDLATDTIKFERCDNDEKEFLVVCEWDRMSVY